MPLFADTRFFQNRTSAGKQLAKQLSRYANENPVILALPRGGVPVGYEIANLLQAPLDIIVTRKIGLPYQREFGIGAIAEGNIHVFDHKILAMLGLSSQDLDDEIHKETTELERRVKTYRGKIKPPHIKNRTVMLVDDGLATGVTARAAIKAVKKLKPKKIIFASPVCAFTSLQEIRSLVDDVICLATPLDLMAIGLWYKQFDQTTDKEVLELLEKNKRALRHEKPGKYTYKIP